jgi:chromosome segregation ATPase
MQLIPLKYLIGMAVAVYTFLTSLPSEMSRFPPAPASRGPSQIASLVAQAREAETTATENHDVLTSLVSKSDDLIAQHREVLLEVTRLSAELAEIEKRRAVLKNALAAQKTTLLITAAETAEVNQLIEQAAESGEIGRAHV